MTPVPDPIRAVRVLLVEDNPADVDLIQETLAPQQAFLHQVNIQGKITQQFRERRAKELT